MDSPLKNVAIVLAGGIGQRFGTDIPKQFLDLGGKTVIEHSIDAFEINHNIDEIAIVIHRDYLQQMRDIVKCRSWKKVNKLLIGGKERYFSTLAAIEAFKDAKELNLIFHDAARPCVSQRIIDDVVSALNENPAVAVAIPTTDTIFEVESDQSLVKNIPNRQLLRSAQTPQAFRVDIISEAYNKALMDENFSCTDDCGVILKYSPEIPIKIVSGELVNMKITYPEDITFLLSYLKKITE